MALYRVKIAFSLSLLCVVFIVIALKWGALRPKPKPSKLTHPHPFKQMEKKNISLEEKMQRMKFKEKEKKSKWKRCKRFIFGEEKMNEANIQRHDSEILDIYKPDEDCVHVLHTRFAYPNVTEEELNFPIAYGFTIYKGAPLFERILQAIYMPHNVYCIHIDKKSPDFFRKAIKAMIRCLPNVFISSRSIDVVWGHISVVQAQLTCMKELLKSSVKWKYYTSLIGQDFPLYENSQIVVALKKLNNSNNMESFPIPKFNEHRTKNVYSFNNNGVQNTGIAKPPPPHNIPIYKGATHIITVREFCEFIIHHKVGKDFIEFLKDTFAPDETIYASLQQHPLAPGGIHGKQPDFIGRALLWSDINNGNVCHGTWVRDLCWIQIEDLQWVLGEGEKDKLFVHKIPFNFPDTLIECILVARQGRKYNTSLFN